MSLIKQTKPTKHMARLCFQTYSKEPKLCVVSHLTEYLKRTKSYRDTDKLFLTCIKPYRAASKETTSRWCKSIIKESGISIHSYTSHSSWSIVIHNNRECRLGSERTFGQFYDKQIEEEVEFQSYLLLED